MHTVASISRMACLAWYDDPLLVVAVALVIILTVGAVASAMRRFGAKKPSPAPAPAQSSPSQTQQPASTAATATPVQSTSTTNPDSSSPYPPMQGMPFRIQKSIQASAAINARNELRMLDLEREILGDAIRRLYEAQAEGKITEAERDKLAASYKQRMNVIKESIAKDEGIIALHELESMQEDLMRLFSERFGDLAARVEELRSRIDVKPVSEIQVKPIPVTPIQIDEEDEDTELEAPEITPKKHSPTVAAPKKRRPPEEKTDQKTEAEKRIESIRSEVEKVLDKLGQMEIET